MTAELAMMEKKSRRRFSVEEKLAILKEWERSENGVEVARKHGVQPNMMYRWKKRLEMGARELLRGKQGRGRKDEAVRRLEAENVRLKEVIVRLSEELTLLKKEMSLD